MSTRQVVARKSPLHPSALRINDLTIGRPIIQFNLALGIIFEGVVVSLPYVGHYYVSSRRSEDERMHLIVKLRSDLGKAETMFLADMGVAPYDDTNEWNGRNFTIDARKRYLLPRPLPSLQGHWVALHHDY